MSKVRVIAPGRRDQLGEGPMWSARHGALFWVDILGRRINRMNLSDERIDSFEQPDHAAWIIERENGGFLAGIGRDIVRLDLEAGASERIATVDEDKPGNRLNDAKADGAGRIWAGTMPLREDQPAGAFYRLDPDGVLTLVDEGYTVANGPAIDPEGRFLLHTDSARRIIFRFDIDEGGSLSGKRPFILFEEGWGHPDGMTFDAEGGLWVACWGGSRIMRFAADGRPDGHIELPASQITSCTFAGADLDRMFVTSAAVNVGETHGGALFEVECGRRGLPARKFAG